jgi:hypothetical protein
MGRGLYSINAKIRIITTSHRRPRPRRASPPSSRAPMPKAQGNPDRRRAHRQPQRPAPSLTVVRMPVAAVSAPAPAPAPRLRTRVVAQHGPSRQVSTHWCIGAHLRYLYTCCHVASTKVIGDDTFFTARIFHMFVHSLNDILSYSVNT